MITLLIVPFFLQKLYENSNETLLDCATQYILFLEAIYSSWVLHVLFVYLTLLLTLHLVTHLND